MDNVHLHSVFQLLGVDVYKEKHYRTQLLDELYSEVKQATFKELRKLAKPQLHRLPTSARARAQGHKGTRAQGHKGTRARWQAAADRPTREAAEKIKNLVLGTAGKHSATWLLHVRQLVSIMEPIRVVLRMMDSSQPVISKVWFALKRMEQAIRAAIVEHNIPNAEQILLATERRTSMLLRPLHGAAALLDPEYRQHFNMRGESSAGQLDFQAVLPDFMKVTEKLSPTSAAECVVQLPKYLHATTAMAAATAKSMPPHEWHRIHTGGALGALAMKVTSQVASATSCERAWSSYGFVHNPRRNRLTASNAEMLTQLYFNSRLLKRAGKGVASKAWEWQCEQGEGEGEGEGEEEGEGEGEGEGEELLQRLQAINEDALEAAVEADMAKETARVAALEAEALALALST
ncbi:hypothetical protein QJQ45_017302 [Haematococcus lacustris]|nr:hypothetical protein QJQ45_017302 [Haematococcus lacustris]